MIEKATITDVIELAAVLRPADRRECLQWCALDAHEAVRRSFEGSEIAFTGRAPDGEILIMFGAKRTNLVTEEALLWALSGEAVNRHPVHFVRHTKEGLRRIEEAMKDVKTFYNYIPLDYPAAIRWMKWAGGTLDDQPAIPGVIGGEFKRFTIKNPFYKEN